MFINIIWFLFCMFSDQDILRALNSGSIGISPFNSYNLGACSYDLSLDESVVLYVNEAGASERVSPTSLLPIIKRCKLPILLEPHKSCVVMSKEKVFPLLEVEA